MTEDTIYVDSSGRKFAGIMGPDGSFQSMEPVFNPAGVISANPLVPSHAYRFQPVKLDVSSPGTWPAGTHMVDSANVLWTSTQNGSVPNSPWRNDGQAPAGVVLAGPQYDFLDAQGTDHGDGRLVVPSAQIVTDLGVVKYTAPAAPTNWTPWLIGGGVVAALVATAVVASRQKRLALGA